MIPFQRDNPGVFYLDAANSEGLRDYLVDLGWLGGSERIARVEKAGEGNMNCTVRVRADRHSFILKQSRPWVEKYPGIEAPWDRALVEGRFYELIGEKPELARHMPKLLGLDPKARMLCLEDLGEAGDFTSVYSGEKITPQDIGTLTFFLTALHAAFRNSDVWPRFANRQMRALNHQHIFLLPLEPDNGLDLDQVTPGLQAAAHKLRADEAYKRKVREAGYLYLSDGDCLLHGDYFPGSWLRSGAGGPKIIDPEFCFFGPPEFDLGVMHAHLALAGQDTDIQTSPLTNRFMGIEIMRRLIGVAQLPLKLGLREKVRLLEMSRELV